jgi:antitoxin component of MazEF toxin-antitoxin module
MAGFLGYHFPPLRSPYGASAQTIAAVKGAATVERGPFFLSSLGATEQDFGLHLLWQHCMANQILPENLKRLPRREVEYLAAHSGDVVYVQIDAGGEVVASAPGRNLKLQENAARAQQELQRRDHRNSAWATSVAALIGGAVGSYLLNLIAW